MIIRCKDSNYLPFSQLLFTIFFYFSTFQFFNSSIFITFAP